MQDLVEAINQLELTTKDGLETAKRLFIQQSRAQTIEDIKNAIAELPLDNPEERSKSIEDIEDLFGALREYNFLLQERPKVEITAWDNIEASTREWLIPQWLPANTVTMFTGEGGAGKSWLTLQAVCQVALGFRDAYLNPDFEKVADITTRRNVIFATYEDEPAEIKRRLEALASGMSWIHNNLSIIKQHLHIVDMRGIGSVWGPGIGNHIANTGDLLTAGEDLRAICEENDARLLVIDPLSGAFGGNENDRTAVYDFISSFRGWGDQARCAMLVIGHLPKTEEGKRAGFSGSTAWEASARSMWMLSKKSFTEGKEKENRHYWTLEHTKSNYAPLQSAIPLIKNKSGWWREAATRQDAADGFDAYQTQLETEDTDDDTGESEPIPQF